MATPEDLLDLAADGLLDLSTWSVREGATLDVTLPVRLGADIVDWSGVSSLTCKIHDKPDGALLLSPTLTGGAGGLRIVITPAQTTGLAGDYSGDSRSCVWQATATLADGRVLPLWGPDLFRIRPNIGA